MSLVLHAGVVGDPVAHSLSPLIHGAWLRGAGIKGTYEPFHVEASAFGDFVQAHRGRLQGLNVTLPHKEAALAVADEASDLARAAGAANVLLFRRDGLIEARNTDGEGLLGALRRQAPGWSADKGPVVLLGAGGAARGAAAALLKAGTTEVRIVNRTLARAQHIALALGPRIRPMEWRDLPTALGDAAAAINATSLGLAGGAPLEIDLDPLPAEAVVMDMVYKPLETPLLAQARARGLTAVDGLEMLIRQAVPSFEAFFGAPPPELDVRALVLEALG